MPDSALQIRTLLRSTLRSSNLSGAIFGNSLFSLARITGAVALLACALGEQDPAVIGSTHGGTIAYIQRAVGDVSCTLVLPHTLVQTVRESVRQRRKMVQTLSLDMHSRSGQLVAHAMITCSARHIREGAARRLPAIAQMTMQLQALLGPASAANH